MLGQLRAEGLLQLVDGRQNPAHAAIAPQHQHLHATTSCVRNSATGSRGMGLGDGGMGGRGGAFRCQSGHVSADTYAYVDKTGRQLQAAVTWHAGNNADAMLCTAQSGYLLAGA